MKQQVKQVPYGVSDFATVMSQNLYYVDKTMFLPELEKQPRNLFFIPSFWKEPVSQYALLLL
jgi:hypothetical protein